MRVATIELRQITKHFAGQTAVADLTLDVADGEFVTLLGPSGCGKTTTLRMLAGFVRPDGGEILVNGRVVSNARQVVPPERRQMGMVFQNYAVWPHMSVFDNVAFGLKVRRVRVPEQRERVERVLDLVGLGGLAARMPSQLSGGQQQRVALARALVIEPSILLLDEPLSNLDAKLRERMRGELKELQERTGITFVYVTHDQTEALTLSDRVAVLKSGKLQQYASARDVYHHPTNSFVADFMGQVTLWCGRALDEASGGDLTRIRLEDGTLIHAVARESVAVDQDLTLAVRPEYVVVGREPGSEINAFSMRVRDVIFLGSVVQVRLERDELRLRAQTGSHLDLVPGDDVYASIAPERLVVLGAPQNGHPRDSHQPARYGAR